MNDSNKNVSQSKTKSISIFLSIIVLGAGIVICLLFFKKSNVFIEETVMTKYDKLFPYVFSHGFQKGVNDYLNNSEFKNLLLVYGPRGLGKTRGLKEIGKTYADNGSLILEFDFLKTNELSTVNDIYLYLRKVIINGFLMLDGKETNPKYLVRLIPLLNEYMIAGNAKKYLKKEKNLLNNNELNDIMNMLLALLNNIKKNPQLSFEIICKILNAFSEYIKPILIFHNIEKLYDCKDTKISEYLDIFWENALSLVTSSLKFPMIFEISDLSPIMDGRIDIRYGLFKLLEVKPFRYEDAKKILVDKEAIFTNENFQSLWDEFGGDGECLYLGYQFLSEGYSIVNAITAIKSYIKESVILSLIVIQNRTLFEKRNEYLKKLLRIPVPLDNDFDSAKFFVKNKIATMRNLTSNSNIYLNENLKKAFSSKVETTTQNV